MSNPPSVALGELMAKKSGSVDPSKFPDETFDLYSIPAFDSRQPEVTAGQAIGSSKQIVKSDDVLLSKIVPHIRRSWVVGVDRGRRLIASGEWIVFRSPRALPNYLRQVLVGDPFHTEFMRTVSGVGGSLLRARLAYVAEIKIPLPPLNEQRRIAEVLDRADALRAKRRAALAQLDSLTQSIFLEMFGDPRVNHERWSIVPLEEIVDETKLGLVRGSNECGPDLPFSYVRMNAITRTGELELAQTQRTHADEAEVEAYRLEPGDFLFNTRNSEELVGKSALFRGGGLHLFNNNLMRIRFTIVADPEFVAAAFKTPFVKRELSLRKSGTTNVFAIYYKDLRSLPLPLPPLPLQQAFARRITAIEALKTTHRAALTELDALFASLQHSAFRGEL